LGSNSQWHKKETLSWIFWPLFVANISCIPCGWNQLHYASPKHKLKPRLLLTEGWVWSIRTQYFGQETPQQASFAIVTLIITILNLQALSARVLKIIPTILASSQHEVIHFRQILLVCCR
jgi:hypothetical protein